MVEYYEHLGSDKIDVRLGGIYALEQIAFDSSKYHWTIVEILSAFIREKCQNDNLEMAHDQKIGIDIQAAIAVLGRRKIEQDPELNQINLRQVVLRKMEIQDVQLSHVDLSFSDLSGADLSGANLSYSILIRTDLKDVNLNDTNLSMSDLNGSDLSRSIMLTQKQLDSAIIGKYTQLPGHLKPKS